MKFNWNIDELFKNVKAPSFTDEEIKKPQATMIQDIFELSVSLNKMTEEDQSMYIALLMATIRVMKHKCAEITITSQQSQNNEPQKFFE